MTGGPYRSMPQQPVGPLAHFLVEVHGEVGRDDLRDWLRETLARENAPWSISISVEPLPSPTRGSLEPEVFGEMIGLPSAAVKTLLENKAIDPWREMAKQLLTGLQPNSLDVERVRSIIYVLSLLVRGPGSVR